jgi:ankyrin repeat protein
MADFARLLMKYLRQFLALEIFTVLAHCHGLWAMYNTDETKKLQQAVRLVEVGIFNKTQDNNSTWPQIVKLCIHHNANPNITTTDDDDSESEDGYGITALHCAAAFNNIDLINFLLDHKANIEAQDNECVTPLSYAAMHGHVEAITQLLSRGANINTMDDEETTPLMRAAFNGHKNAINLLINLGADINEEDEDCDTALSLAALKGNREIVIRLLSAGANDRWFLLDAFHAKGEAGKLLLTYHTLSKELCGEPELHRAIRLKDNNTKLERILAEWGQKLTRTRINQLDTHKQTAFDVAIITRGENAISFLLSHGADPLVGLYNNVFLASKIPAWNNSRDGQPSLYEQILAVPLNRLLATLLMLREELCKDIYNYIIKLVIFYG